MNNIKFFNQPVGKQMRKAFILAGFLCIVQFFSLFLPIGSYHLTLEGSFMMNDLDKTGVISLSQCLDGDLAFLGGTTFLLLFVAMIVCFTTKSSKKVGKGKRIFLDVVAVLYLIVLIGAIANIEAAADDMRYYVRAQSLLGSSVDVSDEVEIASKMTFGTIIGFVIAFAQIAVTFFATFKSKVNNVELQNTPEAKVAKYSQMLKEGLLTQDEYEEKVKQALGFAEK